MTPSKLRTNLLPKIPAILQYGQQQTTPPTLPHPNHPVATYLSSTSQNIPRYLFCSDPISTDPATGVMTVKPPAFLPSWRNRRPAPQTIWHLNVAQLEEVLFDPYRGASETYFTAWSSSLAWTLAEASQGSQIVVLDTTKLKQENHVHWSCVSGDDFLIFGVIESVGGDGDGGVFKAVSYGNFGEAFAGARIFNGELMKGGPAKLQIDGSGDTVHPELRSLVRSAKLYDDDFALPMVVYLLSMFGDCSQDDTVLDTLLAELSMPEDLVTSPATFNKKDLASYGYAVWGHMRWEETDNVMALWRVLFQRMEERDEGERYAEPVKAGKEERLL